MRQTTRTRTCKNEVTEPHTAAITAGHLGEVLYRALQQYYLMYINCIEFLFCRCGWCGCEVRQEALQQRHDYAQPL